MRTFILRAAAVLVTVGLSTSSWAGGRGFVMRPGGAGGLRMGHAMPPVAGTWHVRTGRSFITARSGFSYGHTNTAFGAQPGFARRGVFGHTATAPNGFERYAFGPRYGVDNRGRMGFRAGRYPQVLGGYGYGYGENGGYGGYDGGGYGAGGGNAYGPAPYPAGGYGEPSVASQYSEPALNQGSYGGPGYDGATGEPGQSIVGTGGPQIIVVNTNAGSLRCNCRSARSASPVIYRYGVGTYY